MNSLICKPENLASVVRKSEHDHMRARRAIEERETVALGAMAPAGEREESPENLAFGVFSILVPSMVTSSPTCGAMSRGGYAEQLASAGLGHAVTEIAHAQNIHKALEPAAWDFFFKPYCAGMVEMGGAHLGDLSETEREMLRGRMRPEEETFGSEAGMDEKAPRAHDAYAPQMPPEWPRFKHLRPEECGWDTQMGSRDRARFTYHIMLEDRDELLARAEEHPDDWDANAIQMLSTCKQWSDADKDVYVGEQNEYVRYYVIYVPDGECDGVERESDQPGIVYTVGARCDGVGRDGQSRVTGVEVRKPYAVTCHPDGLHRFEGNYTTGASSHYLSLLAANEDSLSMLESVSASVHQRIRDHKVVHAYDSIIEESMKKIREGDHGGYVGVPGLSEGSGKIQTIETDALTPAEVNEYERMRFNAGRAIGIDDTGLGQADPDATARAVSIAANATRTKIEYLLGRWHRFVAGSMEDIGFHVAKNDRVVVRLSEDSRASVLRTQLAPLVSRGALSGESVTAIVEDQKTRPMMFQGGDFTSGGEAMDWHSLQLFVEPGSMEGAFGEVQIARQLRWNEVLAYLGDVMLRQPHIRWIDRIRATGHAIGITDAQMVVDLDIAKQVAQIQLASGAPNPMTSGTTPRGRDEGPPVTTGGGRNGFSLVA